LETIISKLTQKFTLILNDEVYCLSFSQTATDPSDISLITRKLQWMVGVVDDPNSKEEKKNSF